MEWEKYREYSGKYLIYTGQCDGYQTANVLKFYLITYKKKDRFKNPKLLGICDFIVQNSL